MEAADGAEDQAPQAEERVEEANKRVKELLPELKNITQYNPHKHHATPEVTCEMLRARERERESKAKQRRECELWRRKG
jgi:hypothetical protein